MTKLSLMCAEMRFCVMIQWEKYDNLAPEGIFPQRPLLTGKSGPHAKQVCKRDISAPKLHFACLFFVSIT